jgi:hypothetical protein
MANLPIDKNVSIDSNGFTGGYGNTPNGCRTSDGVLHVVYTSTASGSAIGYAKSTNNGATWGGFTQISRGTAATQGNAVIVADSQDNLHVVWRTLDSPYTNQIEYRKYNKSTTAWLDSVMLTTDNGNYQYGRPTLTIDSANNIHVTWTGYSNSSPHDVLRYIKCTNGTWGSIEDLSPTDHNAAGPSIVTDTNNNPHIVTYLSKSPNYYIRVYSKDETWGYTNILATTYATGTAPAICIDPTTNEMFAVYRGKSASYSAVDNIYFSKTVSGVWQTPVNITTDTAYAQGVAHIVRDKCGDIWISWNGITASSATYNNLRCVKYTNGSFESIMEVTTSTSEHVYGTMLLTPFTGINFCCYYATALTLYYISSTPFLWEAPKISVLLGNNQLDAIN